MLPPPPPAGQPRSARPAPRSERAPRPVRDRTGLAVLLVALAVLLGLVALVWWINETESDGRWQSDVGRAPAFSSPARSEPPPVAFRPRGTII